jgi:hypothetical protein
LQVLSCEEVSWYSKLTTKSYLNVAELAVFCAHRVMTFFFLRCDFFICVVTFLFALWFFCLRFDFFTCVVSFFKLLCNFFYLRCYFFLRGDFFLLVLVSFERWPFWATVQTPIMSSRKKWNSIFTESCIKLYGLHILLIF